MLVSFHVICFVSRPTFYARLADRGEEYKISGYSSDRRRQNNKKHSYSNQPDMLVKSFFRSIHRETQNPVIFLISSVCIAPALRGMSKKEAAFSMLVTFSNITATCMHNFIDETRFWWRLATRRFSGEELGNQTVTKNTVTLRNSTSCCGFICFMSLRTSSGKNTEFVFLSSFGPSKRHHW